ncbi:hypothetical protein ACFLRF_01100 [Candidatus Altiarchaeota archaeon]
MKKIFVLILGLLIVSAISLAAADDDTDLEAEADAMHTPPGAQYRLDQLEISLENHIERAKDILTEVNVSDDAMSELEDYVIELELLLERVQEMEPTGTPSEMAADFVAIKKEAITTTQNFRKALHDSVIQEKIAGIKERIRERHEERRNASMARIRERKEKMYMTRLSGIITTLGIEDEDLMAQVGNGSLTKREAKDMITDAWKNLSKEDKTGVRLAVKEKRDAAKADIKARKEQAKARLRAKQAEIKADWKAKMAERKANFRAKLSERKEAHNERKDARKDAQALKKEKPRSPGNDRGRYM